MAKFSVSKSFTMSREEVREAAGKLAEQLKADHGLRYTWQGDTARFSRSGIDGVLKIEADVIRVEVKLGFMASAFEGPLKKAMNEYLDRFVA